MSNSLSALDFDLGDTTDALRSEVARFAANEIAPRAAEIDVTNEFRPIHGASSAIWASSASPRTRNMAAPAWATSPTASPWRRSAVTADAKLYEIGAGTSEIRRMLIGRELFNESL